VISVKKMAFLSATPLRFLLALYGGVLALYALFSYALTDPNLVLVNWQPYWQFQIWMWETFFKNPQLTTGVYSFLLLVAFLLYLFIVKKLEQSSLEYAFGWKKYALIYGLVLAPLFFSYNALSHDVFNYIFNAKMLVAYGANPHEAVALSFSNDPWTRFMHNTHTPAPYGYGWTAISLIPYLSGFGKFFLTWIAFRIWSIISIVLLYVGLQYAAKIFTGQKLQAYQLAVVFFNPLFVLEVVSNMHNDLWMIVPAVVALAAVTDLDPRKTPQLKKLGLALLLLAASISIKLATLVLIPLVVLLVLEKNFLFTLADSLSAKLPLFKLLPARILQSLESYLYQYIPLLAAGLLFIPLLTSRSQQFHPWYWLWVLVWIPFIRYRFLRNLLILFSLSSMLRYIPWLWTGGFAGEVLLYQKLITWTPGIVYVVWRFFPWALSQHPRKGFESQIKV
jgi:hypothetical protein